MEAIYEFRHIIEGQIVGFTLFQINREKPRVFRLGIPCPDFINPLFGPLR